MRSPAELEPLPQRRPLAPIALACLGVVFAGWLWAENRALSLADQEVRARWTQLTTTWRDRTELVPKLVELVKEQEGFEPTVVTEVATARARVVQLTLGDPGDALRDGPQVERLAHAELLLSGSLQRLLAASRAHAALAVRPEFRVLESQLEALDGRVVIERLRFNEAVRAFNATRSRFPAVIIAGLRAARFGEKPFLDPVARAEKAPGPSTR